MKKTLNNNQPNPSPQIDLTKTISIPNESGGSIYSQGYVLRKVSRFVTNSNEDAVLPIPVFYDSVTGKILGDTLPPELRDEYDNI